MGEGFSFFLVAFWRRIHELSMIVHTRTEKRRVVSSKMIIIKHSLSLFLRILLRIGILIFHIFRLRSTRMSGFQSRSRPLVINFYRRNWKRTKKEDRLEILEFYDEEDRKKNILFSFKDMFEDSKIYEIYILYNVRVSARQRRVDRVSMYNIYLYQV